MAYSTELFSHWQNSNKKIQTRLDQPILESEGIPEHGGSTKNVHVET